MATDTGGPQPQASTRLYPWEQPHGAVPSADGTTCFRVWAPRPRQLALRLGDRELELEHLGFGVHELVAEAAGGQDYCYVVDGKPLPDPASRWQPYGLRGPSRVLDPAALRWTDAAFCGPALGELVIYELHVGAFTQPGTFEAAIEHLDGLVELGVTTIELMPVAEFPGRHGWGYDGVYLSAAHSAYGGPLGLATLVDAAHARGLAVILDVVYNHLGASGVRAMEAFGPYFTRRHETAWGRAMNFDDADCDPVREWVIQSALGWVADLHIDGLRLDALHAIVDTSPEHVIADLTRRVHMACPRALVIAESGLNDPRVVRSSERGGWSCDAVWADDFHHALHALLTGERDGYYGDFGRLADLAKAFRRPHVYTGGYSRSRRRRFGAPADDVAPQRFVVFSQNHDQVGNRALGDRLPAWAQPLAAFCTLLSPFTPLLFMGEEYAERQAFQFFCDHIDAKIVRATREGRRREFAAFAQFRQALPDPQDPVTFERSKLSGHGEPALRGLYAALLRARAELALADVDDVEHDEQARWLRVRRGPAELICNFATQRQAVACRGKELVLATHPTVLSDGRAVLEALSGALVR